MSLPNIKGLSGGVVGDSARTRGGWSSKILVEFSHEEALELELEVTPELGVC